MLRELISEDNGRVSAMRVGFLIVVCSTMIPYGIICLVKVAMVDIPTGVAALVSAFGVAKWLQKGKESDA